MKNILCRLIEQCQDHTKAVEKTSDVSMEDEIFNLDDLHRENSAQMVRKLNSAHDCNLKEF